MHQPGTSSPGVRLIVRTSYKSLTLDTGYINIAAPERTIIDNPPRVQIDRVVSSDLNELSIYWRHIGGNDIKELQYNILGQWHKAFTLDNPFKLKAFILPDRQYGIKIRGVDRFDKIGIETNEYPIKSRDYPKILEMKEFILSIKEPIKLKIKDLSSYYKTVLEIGDNIKRLITKEDENIRLTNEEIEKLYRKYGENIKLILRTYGQVYENNTFVNKEYEDIHIKKIQSKGNHNTIRIKKDNKIRKGIVYIRKNGEIKTGIIYIRKGNIIKRGIL